MKYLLRLTLALSIVMMTACHHDDDEEEARYVERTILLYFPWSTNLYNHIQENIRDIEQAICHVKGLNGSRVMVWVSDNKRPTDAVLYEINYSERENRCKHDTVQHYTNTPLTTAEHISNVWNDVKRYARPDGGHYGMIIGCHGMGWISRADWNKYSSKKNMLKSMDDSQAILTRWFGGSGEAYQTDIETLAEGMRAAGIHTDYIQFDDCYMANIETAYTLSQVTDYLIASPVEMMAYGMPYQQLWNVINDSQPSFQRYVDTFKSFYSTYSIPCGALSVTDCRETEALAILMREAHASHTLSPEQRSELQVMDGMTHTLFYDFGNYARLLCGDNTGLWQRIKSQLDKTVVAKGCTHTFYSAYNERQTEISEYSGLTTSEPSSSEMVIYALPHTAWWQYVHGTK